MVRIPFVAVACFLGFMPIMSALGACESEPFQGDLVGCPCDDGACSAAACPIEILLDQTCADEITVAEALIGDHVEREVLRPNRPFVACSKIEPGANASIIVRGGPWVWGPLGETCATPGETRSLVLQCVEASN